ncbi:hypothetical protein PPERSA_02820 [Pseudocohnilembus persalinus]|uniref:Serine hydrolase domain-containing protein n=1 Tax=Pseudocohnilembus persalinus TaxID=266149 RepID=A0A0V0QMZ3_PSEPJ|nr:hypothetical protein PPERSA_02820 [Pseudocohnilembus persalinus]|eukprot:KRX03441.1 hypothetical protein PPERSA_02820 [Pseudocohnilembus persalinus]
MRKGKKIKILCLHDINNDDRIMKMQMQPLLLKVGLQLNAEYVYARAPIVKDYYNQVLKNQQNKLQNETNNEQNSKKQQINFKIKKGQGWFVKELFQQKNKLQLNKANQELYTQKIRYAGIQKSLDYLRDILDRSGPFDGVLGLGQGADLLSIMCMRRTDINQSQADKPYCFNFAIFVDAQECNIDEQFAKDFEGAQRYIEQYQQNNSTRMEFGYENQKDQLLQFEQQYSQDFNFEIQKVQSRFITEIYQENAQQFVNNKELMQSDNENYFNKSVNMPTFHIYPKGNEQAKKLSKYFVQNKAVIKEFETLDQRIPEHEKQYFKQKGHEIKYKGPRNKSIPSEFAKDFINFIHSYQMMEKKKEDFQKGKNKKVKPEVPLVSELQEHFRKIQIQQAEREKQKDKLGLFTEGFDKVNEEISKEIFESAKHICTDKISDKPCVYKFLQIAYKPKQGQKQGEDNLFSQFIFHEEVPEKQYKLCDNCTINTRSKINELYQTGLKKLLPMSGTKPLEF